MVIASTANPNLNWSTIIPLLVQLLYVLVPAVLALVGLAAKKWLDTHTSGSTQDILEKITATVVQATEQTFAGQQSTPQTQRAKFDAAAAALTHIAAERLHVILTDTQMRTLIESGVHALNAGAVALVPGSAPLLPADTAATTGMNLDQFKQDVLDTMTKAVPGVVQSTLAGILGAAVSQSGAQQAPTPTPPQSPAQPTIGQVSSAPQADVVVQPGVTVGLAGQPTAAQNAPQPPVQPQ